MRRLALDPMDIPAVQAWLEDWAARGWYLDAYGMYFAKFTPGEKRENVRYRLQPVKGERNDPDEDMRATYQEMGWTFVCSLMAGSDFSSMKAEFRVWRCDDPTAPELDTEQSLREADYIDLLRRRRRDIWLILPLLALLVGVMLWAVWDHPRQFLVEEYPPSSMLLLCANSLICLHAVSRFIRLIRFTRRLRSEELVPQRAPWRGAQRRMWLFRGAYLAIVLVMIGGLFHLRDERPWLPVSQWEEPAPYVSLAELGTPAKAGARAVDFHSILAKGVWWINEGYYETPPFCNTQYYGLRSPSMAANLERQLLKRLSYTADIADHPEFQIALPGVDSAWFWRDELQERQQFLLLHRGGQVISVLYRGDADLLEHTDDYIALLEEFR